MTFDDNGGSDVMIPKTGVHGDYVLPACEYIAPEGKEFAGWKVNGQGDLLQAGDKINLPLM